MRLATLLLGLLVSPAWAFEGYEHRAMGNLAYAAALNHQSALEKKSSAVALTPEEWTLIKDFSKRINNVNKVDNGASYGQILKCVDDFLIPEKMFNLTSTKERRHWFPDRRDEIGIGQDDCYGESGTWLSAQGGKIAAGHANHNHFQDDLLTALNMHHSAALGIASDSSHKRDPARLFGALAMNAIADHYLQDFFAPGHLVTARANLTDTLSNATHDLANEKGIHYYVGDATRELIATISDGLTSQVKAGLCLRPAENNTDTDPISEGRANANCLSKLDQLVANFPLHILLRGDARLWRNDDDGLAQRILILAVEVRSILDVIESYRGQTSNSFQNIEWDFSSPERAAKGSILTKVQARKQHRNLRASFGYGTYDVREKEEEPPEIQADTSYKIPEFSPLLGVQVARESMFNGERYGRTALTGYVSPFCYFCFQKDGIPNVIPSFGLVYLSEYPFHAWGGEGRLSAILPNTETTASVYLRDIRYSVNGNHRWGKGAGIRLEQGFSSFYSLFLGVGKDYGQTASGTFERRWMFYAGLNFTIPAVHINKILQDRKEKD